MMAVAVGWGYGKELSEILGIERITDVTFHFPLEGVVKAQVEFLVSDVQAKAVLAMMKDGAWKSPQSHPCAKPSGHKVIDGKCIYCGMEPT